MNSWTLRYWQSFSFVGLVVATIFFCGSVTPSLLPRPYFVQGILSGFSLAIGYGVGVALVWLWMFLELPKPSEKLELRSKQFTVVCVALVFVASVWRATFWQNSIRQRMEMPPLETADPYRFFLISIVVACLMVAVLRALLRGCARLTVRLERYVPPRIAAMVSMVVISTLTILVANGVVARGLLALADQTFSNADELIDEGIAQPSEPLACGSVESNVPWDSIGRQGKNFIAGGPTKQSISEFTGDDAKTPLRVYVGVRSAEDEEQRAALAVQELKRVGGFDRKILVVATPTGTGWLDQGAVDTLEYMHDGDTAIVSTQYSYLPSWITILVDPSCSRRSATALFDQVYAHWTTLPKDDRPQLHLFGLSLGSFGCEDTANLLKTFQDPIQGSVKSGPPFPSTRWASIVSERNPGSSVWLPTFRDGSMIRFTSQQNRLESGKAWGPIRDVYIQHASDPMVWFSPSLAWHRPAWLNDPRGPDVSPQLRWYPIVTFLQIAFDLPMATSVPIGYGHNYAPANYIDAWMAVTDPPSWEPDDVTRLKNQFAPSAP
ncbi:hypothetical protein K227x_08910 [Rubripirellula lacrimiformis]|uniref:Alpha/beta-hydrolase family protein n=1 Tax=Rubripirellula lacrimiformis TaxID=1930273 RepID=A0A517N5W4_9BACT|nr:alpha/beta-hydrolase family protein [Rubripirellula lacrimiformis]QDT02513.1 hypothetical protein K227x_08910 [Rubripirellula lacrimiformis]